MRLSFLWAQLSGGLIGGAFALMVIWLVGPSSTLIGLVLVQIMAIACTLIGIACGGLWWIKKEYGGR